MKKKYVACSIAILAVAIFGVCFTACLKTCENMVNTFRVPTTGVSSISFSGKVNERIKFSFKSNVEAGELDIVLYDSNRNVVYELDRAKELETYYTFEKADMYTLEAEYSNFVGSYKMAVYEVD